MKKTYVDTDKDSVSFDLDSVLMVKSQRKNLPKDKSLVVTVVVGSAIAVLDNSEAERFLTDYGSVVR